MQQQSQQQQLKQQQQRTAAEPSPEIKAEVNVSTASAIIISATDPYMVLVAKSAKHPYPVIPGGKIEYSDLAGEKKADVSAVIREISEEIGTPFLGEPKYLGYASDPGRDIRIVPASKVMTAVVEPALPSNIKNDDMVKAHYGNPDYIYVGTVDPSKIVETEELKEPRFINIRKLNPGDLSAGHDVIVMTYRSMLEQSLNQLPENSLQSFMLERDNFQTRTRLSREKPGPEKKSNGVLINADRLTNVSEGLYGDGKDVHGDANRIFGDITGLKGPVSSIAGDVSNIQGDVSNIVGYTSDIKGNVSNIRGPVTALYGDVSRISGNVSCIFHDVSNMRGDVSGLSGNVSGLSGEVSGVSGEATGINGDCTGLTGSLQSNIF